MNNRGQKGAFGLILAVIAVVFIMSSFALIEPFKEFLDTARDTTSLNCPGTTNFDQTDYDNDTRVEKLTRRPTCFVTGISMVYFIGTFIAAVLAWLLKNWRAVSR